MLVRCKHENGHDVLLDTENQCYYNLPESGYLYGKHGVKFKVFDSLIDFINSDSLTGVIHAFCSSRKNIKKRFSVTLETFLELFTFYNVEFVHGWEKNNIDNMYSGKAYRILIKRNKSFENGCEIIFAKELNKDPEN